VAPEIGVSWRRILILLVLVAGLGTYLYVYELPQAREEGSKKKLLGVDKDAIVGLDLVFPDREIALKKGDKGWRLTKPVDAPADEATVKALVSTLADAEIQKTLDEAPADPAAFGLDKPTPLATVTLSSGTAPPPVAVGKNTTIGGKTYVRKGNEPKVYLTASSLNLGLNKQVKDLRDKQILVFQDDDVQRVDIAADGGGTTALVRKDKDSWTVQPGDKPADLTEVRSYLSTLRTTRATDFPDDAPADLGKYGLDKPRLSVTVGSGKDAAETQTLLLGGESTQGTTKLVYAKRGTQPTVYAVGDWTMRSLSKQAGDFRDKTVLALDQSRVTRLVIERKEGNGTTAARADGKWTVEGAGDQKPNETTLTRYLDDAHELRGASIAAEPPGDLHRFGLDAPDLRVTFSDKDGQPIGSLIGAKHDGKYYVMKANGETVFEARDYMYARLDKKTADFVGSGEPPAAAGAPKGTPSPPAMPAAPDEDEPEPDEGE
jgi:hypothetical protein